MAINIKKIEKQILENIINDYQNGKSMRQIDQDYGVTRQSVAKYLESVNKDLVVTKFVRFEVGEGMEKKNEDFAAEVAAQLG